VHTDSPLYTPRSRRRRRSLSSTTAIAIVAGIGILLAVLVGLAFAGSRSELAAGTQVAGVDVGGLTKREALAKLDALFERRSDDPVEFVAGARSYRFAANQLAVQPNWDAAVAAAGRAGDGFGPLRGFRRIRARVFGAEVLPQLAVSNAALEYALDQVGDDVNRVPKSAALVRRGVRIDVVPEQMGARLDREAAAEVIVRTLGQVERAPGAMALPVRVTAPPVSAELLAGPAERARVAVSGPLVLRAAGTSFRVPRWRVAELLSLPSGGTTKLAIGGAAAEAYFRHLSDRVGRPAQDARFAVYGEAVQVVPARTGLELNVPQAARAILQAATRPTNRVARLTIAGAAPDRTTAEALAMGIDRRMSSYKTYYSGTADRITNLQLGVRALDGTLVSPGGTFSLNDAIGERTVDRGFRSAPVIIGNEYAEEIGGGTSQVATTAFNAAWEAGLRITERHPHSSVPARPRCHRVLALARPQVRERHREVGARQGVRRRRRHQHRDLRRREPAHRELGDPSRRDRPGSRQADRRAQACEGEEGRRARGHSADAYVGDEGDLQRRREAHPLRDVDDVIRGRGSRRPPGDEGRGAEAQEPGRDHAGRPGNPAAGDAWRYDSEDSALAIASASHVGTRVGRYVSRSTVA
jgi:vancomycin resistance protein YoaR